MNATGLCSVRQYGLMWDEPGNRNCLVHHRQDPPCRIAGSGGLLAGYETLSGAMFWETRLSHKLIFGYNAQQRTPICAGIGCLEHRTMNYRSSPLQPRAGPFRA